MDQDQELQKIAFYWKSEGEVIFKKEEENRLKQQEGENFATMQKAMNLELNKQETKKKKQMKQIIKKTKKNKKIQK